MSNLLSFQNSSNIVYYDLSRTVSRVCIPSELCTFPNGDDRQDGSSDHPSLPTESPLPG